MLPAGAAFRLAQSVPPGTPQVMDALYQVRVHKSETDLSIDALRETLCLLAAERAPGASKLEKRLEEVRGSRCAPRVGARGRSLCMLARWRALRLEAPGPPCLTVHAAPRLLPQLAHRWESIKKASTQAKSHLEPIQACGLACCVWVHRQTPPLAAALLAHAWTALQCARCLPPLQPAAARAVTARP